MEKKDYLGYIAHFVKNIDQRDNRDTPTSENEYRAFFVKHLGTTNIISAPDPKIRDLSRHLYKAYVASLYIRYGAYYLASTLTSKQLSELIAGQTGLIDEYGLYKSIDDDIAVSNIDRHIKKDGLDTYRSILTKYLPKSAAPKKTAPPKKTAVTKKAPAKKPAPKKVAAKTTKKAAPKKPVAKGKSCKEYGLPALKQMAKDAGIRGYSKMNKPALCAALGIKA